MSTSTPCPAYQPFALARYSPEWFVFGNQSRTSVIGCVAPPATGFAASTGMVGAAGAGAWPQAASSTAENETSRNRRRRTRPPLDRPPLEPEDARNEHATVRPRAGGGGGVDFCPLPFARTNEIRF